MDVVAGGCHRHHELVKFVALVEKAVGPFVETALPVSFSLSVNGESRQRGDTCEMIFSVEKLMTYLEKNFGLAEGDIIFTGTSAGVSPLKSGDRIAAELAGGISKLELTVA